MLTLEIFNSIEPDAIIAKGTCINSPDDIFMTVKDIGRELLWVAVKGYGNDWAIYIHWSDKGFDFVLNGGDKVNNKHNIMKLVPCVEEVFKLYRY